MRFQVKNQKEMMCINQDHQTRKEFLLTSNFIVHKQYLLKKKTTFIKLNNYKTMINLVLLKYVNQIARVDLAHLTLL